MSNVAQWFAAEKESPAFYAWGESQQIITLCDNTNMKNKTLIKTEYLFDGHWYEQSEILQLFPSLVMAAKELNSKVVPTKNALDASKTISEFLNSAPVRFTYQ